MLPTLSADTTMSGQRRYTTLLAPTCEGTSPTLPLPLRLGRRFTPVCIALVLMVVCMPAARTVAAVASAAFVSPGSHIPKPAPPIHIVPRVARSLHTPPYPSSQKVTSSKDWPGESWAAEATRPHQPQASVMMMAATGMPVPCVLAHWDVFGFSDCWSSSTTGRSSVMEYYTRCVHGARGACIGVFS